MSEAPPVTPETPPQTPAPAGAPYATATPASDYKVDTCPRDAIPPAPAHPTIRSPLPPLPLEPVETPLTLGAHLRREVLLGGFAVPAWLLSSASVVTTAVVSSLVATLILVASLRGDEPLVATSFGTLVQPSTAREVPLQQRAATGDPAAMKELENRGAKEETVDDVVALADGRAAQRRRELADLVEDLTRNPKLGEDPDVLRRLRAATENPEMAREALRILAGLPGPGAVDMIYDIWIGTKGRNDTTRLAEELVFLASVRQKASPALAVTLDLRDTKECSEVSKLVDRAIEHGDRRTVRMLGLLTLRTGCGARKAEDCYPCLRSDHRLTDALSAAMRRAKPKL